MIVLPIDAASNEYPVGPQWETGFTPQIPTEPPFSPRSQTGASTERGRCSRSAGGQGPPVAQSINSTVWTTGSFVPAAICVMQPILPAAITSGRNLSIVPTLRSRNLLAMSGCRILYVPAEPQHRWPSGTSFTTKPSLSEQLLRLPRDALAVLQRAGRVIGDDKPGRRLRPASSGSVSEIFGDILGEACHLARPGRHRPDRCAA